MTATPTRRLGIDGPEVSAIGLGFMSFRTGAGPDDEKQAKDIVDAAIDLGITLFDTADIYGPEFSEILLGKAIEGRRDALTIATKFGNRLDRDSNPDGRALDGRPEYVRSAIEGSLRRLGVDHVDLYYQHRVDPQVPIEDTVGALKELVEAGKIRHVGLSEPGRKPCGARTRYIRSRRSRTNGRCSPGTSRTTRSPWHASSALESCRIHRWAGAG